LIYLGSFLISEFKMNRWICLDLGDYYYKFLDFIKTNQFPTNKLIDIKDKLHILKPIDFDFLMKRRQALEEAKGDNVILIPSIPINTKVHSIDEIFDLLK